MQKILVTGATGFVGQHLVEYLKLSHDKKSSDIIISDLVKKILRKYIKIQLGKKPEVDVHIIRL